MNLFNNVLGKGAVGHLIVLRMLGSSVGCLRGAFVQAPTTFGQLAGVVPLQAGVAGGVVDDFARARLLLDGESESAT